MRRIGLTLDSRDLHSRATPRVRWALAVSGVAALVIGVLITIWPTRSAVAIALLFGVYWVVAGVGYALMGIVAKGVKPWSRVLDIVLGLVQLALGVIIILNPAESAVFLGVFLGIWLGVMWIFEGIVALVQSGDVTSSGWAIFFGIISILGGIAVLTSPLWAMATLFLVGGILLIILGLVQIVRAITFGRGGRHAA